MALPAAFWGTVAKTGYRAMRVRVPLRDEHTGGGRVECIARPGFGLDVVMVVVMTMFATVVMVDVLMHVIVPAIMVMMVRFFVQLAPRTEGDPQAEGDESGAREQIDD